MHAYDGLKRSLPHPSSEGTGDVRVDCVLSIAGRASARPSSPRAALLSHGRRFQMEATVLVRWYRWPLLSIGEADPTLWGGGTGPGWVSTARVAARGRCDGGPQPASAGASKPEPRRSTFEYIVKPEVIAIGGRRCGHHRSTTGRDDNAVACRMDRDVRLWVAISVAGSDVLVGDCGRTSKLTNYAHLNIGSPGGPGSWAGSLVSG